MTQNVIRLGLMKQHIVCDSECPYDLILGRRSMAQLSAWQDYMTNKLYIQQISIPLTVRNNIWILPAIFQMTEPERKDRNSNADFMT